MFFNDILLMIAVINSLSLPVSPGLLADAFLGWERRADSRMFGFEIFGDYVVSLYGIFQMSSIFE